jgi:hypothetical protein
VTRDAERDDATKRSPSCGRAGSSAWHENRGKHLRKGVRILRLLRRLTRPILWHEKLRSFLFSRLDLLNRTDPGEADRNVCEQALSLSLRFKPADSSSCTLMCWSGRRTWRERRRAAWRSLHFRSLFLLLLSGRRDRSLGGEEGRM